MENIDNRLKQVYNNLVQEHLLTSETLTEKQFITLIKHMCACGDFMRLVRIDNNSQVITYIPYRREQELQNEIKLLKEHIKNLIL